MNGQAKAREVKAMFTRIASSYDLMNRLMSLGRDRAWRRELLKAASLPERGQVLDVGCGTADLAIEGASRGMAVIALDFCPQMMSLGQAKVMKRRFGDRVGFVLGDAEALPFADDSFDAVITGFALRNITSIARCFSEMRRVLRPGGHVASLELVTPARPLMQALHRLYLGTPIPLLSRLLTKDSNAYSCYLPQSIADFPQAEEVKAIMEKAGFRSVRYRLLGWGTVAIHCGEKDSY